ncbi:MAG: putative system TPR-repeat lipoprotein [Pedosphaera sp.]|nr:putative system TPR-repeat lipoprotein [Pedosphaera sp.]
MSTEKFTKTPVDKAKSASASAPTPAPASAKVAPFFRKVDWLTLGIATLLIFIGYFLTVAPDVTLEDSGELATGSYYAGVPHPPGYPLWTIMTHLFTLIFPVGNIAYRVAVASAVASALAAGFLGLLVSRGNSMMIEGIAEFKDLPKNLENAICVVSGVTAALLLAFNGYMWSQSVIVEVYPFSVLSLMITCTLVLRWMYAPQQRRYIIGPGLCSASVSPTIRP